MRLDTLFGGGQDFGAPGYTFGGWVRLLVHFIHFWGADETFGVPGYTFGGRARLWCAWIHFWGVNFNFRVVKIPMKALNALKSDDKSNPLSAVG